MSTYLQKKSNPIGKEIIFEYIYIGAYIDNVGTYLTIYLLKNVGRYLYT